MMVGIFFRNSYGQLVEEWDFDCELDSRWKFVNFLSYILRLIFPALAKLVVEIRPDYVSIVPQISSVITGLRFRDLLCIDVRLLLCLSLAGYTFVVLIIWVYTKRPKGMFTCAFWLKKTR